MPASGPRKATGGVLAIIGCGNPTRSDDGVGSVVVQRVRALLAHQPRPQVAAFDTGTDGMAVMFAARGADALVIVDASRTNSPAGAIHEVPGNLLERPYVASLNLHDFRWEHALAAGRRIDGGAFPADVTVLLVEAASLEFGLELTPAVAAAADAVVARILTLIDAYAAKIPGRIAAAEALA